MSCCCAGSRVASTAELAGDEVPALFTIGRDGALFYWMYEPPAPGSNPRGQPQGYPHIPGKHRKRKAPDTDPVRPEADVTAATAAALEGPTATSSDDEADGDDNSGSSSSNSDAGDGADAALDGKGDDAAGEHRQTSTSGRQHTEQAQTTSFAGKRSLPCVCCSSAYCWESL